MTAVPDTLVQGSTALRPQPARARHRVSSHQSSPVEGAWQLVGLPPESVLDPQHLDAVANRLDKAFHPMDGACSVGAALHRIGSLALDAPPDLDGRDWWIRCDFTLDVAATDTRSTAVPSGSEMATQHLVFEGLATIVDVWLNGTWLGRAENMFVCWEADVSALLRAQNELVLCARALTTRLAPRRPRARWRARLLATQEWRWHRTAQMGRMPGFGPQVPLVGPWRPISLERRASAEITALDVAASYVDGHVGLAVDARIRMDSAPGAAVLSCGAERSAAIVTRDGDGWRVQSRLESATLARWQPHTHGEPIVHECALHIEAAGGGVSVQLGPIGFRSLALDASDGRFALTVNGERPFLRGTCWTPRNWLAPDLSASETEAEMRLLRDAGINCIRLSGCFTYGSESLLAACDRHGIMVWHDLMFSVLDYPCDDAFAESCVTEVAQRMAALQTHACVVTVCGSAEVDQQAAMMGVALDSASHPLFHERLAEIVRATLPNVPYWPSTPSGGVVPFRVDTGTAHYFGVGAYERPLDDARRSAPRFVTECLAFAQLPEPESPAALALDDEPGNREPWKARVPRDGGVDWDFEDTRDFYVGHLFAVDPAMLRREDPHRYLELGRAATAAVVERTMQEFRRTASACQGALTWLWADPWAGAGWGHIDAAGRPKSSWYAMRRALRPVALALTNEGMNGVDVHAWNDRPERVHGQLHVRLLRDGCDVVRAGSCPLSLDGGHSARMSVEEVLGQFVDVAWAYRFGASTHDTVHAVWLRATEGGGPRHDSESTFADRTIIDESVLLVHGDARPTTVTGLRARLIRASSDGDAVIALTTSSLAQAVRIGSAAYRPSDSYFTLVPGVERRVTLSTIDPSAERSVVVEALNDATVCELRIDRAAANTSAEFSATAVRGRTGAELPC